jgi:hypothetical protein
MNSHASPPADQSTWTCGVCGKQGIGTWRGVAHVGHEHPGADIMMALFPDRTRALHRVRDLIELSASPNENEARTAAKLACDLIRRYKFL